MQVEVLNPAIAAPLGLPRSEGIHVSSVIRAIAVENKVLKPEYVESLDLIERSGSNSEWWDRLDQPSKTRMLMGLAWERTYIETQLPHVVHQPGEMFVEGLYMTHDGESLDTVLCERDGQSHLALALHEVKLTYKSWNTIKGLETQWLWLTQMKAYCKGLGTRLAYLHVLCVCGDYSYPMTPMPKVFRVLFTDLEIADNWELLTGYVRHRQQQEAEDMMRDTE